MSHSNIEQTFRIAVEHHQAGRLQQADSLYRQILAQQPEHAGALHYLGVIAARAGRHDIAVDLIRQAIALSQDRVEAHSDLAAALSAIGQFDHAIAAARQAIALRPDYAEAHSNLASALNAKGRIDEAICAYRQAITLRPDYAEAWHNLGNVLAVKGRLDEAIAAHRQVIALRPEIPEAHYNLGNMLIARGQFDEAVAAYRQAIALRPNYADAFNNLASALNGNGQIDQAVAAARQAMTLRPNFAEACYNLGNLLAVKGQLDDAVAAHRQAVVLRPNYPEAYNNLGNVLKDQGQLDEAIASLRRAFALDPAKARAHSNLIFALHYHPACDPRTITRELGEWNRQHAQPLKRFIRPHTNDRDPDRRLRIGYVSPDFCNHPIGRFMVPLLAHHNKSHVEVFAYCDVLNPDVVTSRLRKSVDVWRDMPGLADDRAADQIRSDRIDILIDLTMHGADNRLLVFARKPAPVQVTYLAYCSSTGLQTIDYRLSDPHLDPPGMDESIYSEQTVRLPGTYWCYEPIVPDLEVGPLPRLGSGFVTFGSLNNFCKVSEPVLATWIQVMRNLPDSRLLLHAKEGSHRQRVLERMERDGINSARIEFAGSLPTQQYFELYQRIDIGLDTFPYGGGTTTCDALWMGVPVVSLAGKTGVGRGGVSLLSNIGFAELIADSPEKYVRIATELASDLVRLGRLRSTLRTQMSNAPLMDAATFAADIEAAYRQMWRKYVGVNHPGLPK